MSPIEIDAVIIGGFILFAFTVDRIKKRLGYIPMKNPVDPNDPDGLWDPFL